MEALLTAMVDKGGLSAVAVIIVVVIFLKAFSKFAAAMREVAASCHSWQKEAQGAFQAQIGDLQQRYDRRSEEINERYDRVNREVRESMDRVATALTDNGVTLKEIRTDLRHGAASGS